MGFEERKRRKRYANNVCPSCDLPMKPISQDIEISEKLTDVNIGGKIVNREIVPLRIRLYGKLNGYICENGHAWADKLEITTINIPCPRNHCDGFLLLKEDKSPSSYPIKHLACEHLGHGCYVNLYGIEKIKGRQIRDFCEKVNYEARKIGWKMDFYKELNASFLWYNYVNLPDKTKSHSNAENLDENNMFMNFDALVNKEEITEEGDEAPCPYCGTMLSKDATICYACGAILEEKGTKNKNLQYESKIQQSKAIPIRDIKQIYAVEKKRKHNFGDFFSYEIVRKIGSGGFSDVYEVEANGKRYAMKIPKGIDLSGSDTVELTEDSIEKYSDEAEIWATLTEKEPTSVVNLLDAGIRPFPWFVMEIAESDYKKGMKNSNNAEKLRTAIQLLGKLDKIHHYGIVHKDIKPENILYVGGEWKFTDFGLSKVLSTSSKSSTGFSGTMFYMAPEQISRRHFGSTDWRTDIWQMGVLIYEMLTGHLPFESDDAFEITGMILRDEPVPATYYGVDERMWDVIRKALEKRKEERWQSAGEFRRELEVDIHL